MSYLKKSLPKDQQISNPGAATAKDQEITIMDTADILYMPDRDQNGVLITGSIIMKPDARMYTLYLTPSTQEPSAPSDGDEDAESFTHKVMGFHPGNSLEVKEFVQNWTGRPVIAMWSGCNNATGKEVYGSPCAPLKLKSEFVANNDKTGFTLTFESVQKTRFVPATYTGDLSYEAYFAAANHTIDLTEASGALIQQLPASNAVTAIDIDAIDFPHGSIVSFIGGGGSDPATLSNGAATAVTVVLKSGTTWTALDKAIINFEVFDDGTTTFLLERSRG